MGKALEAFIKNALSAMDQGELAEKTGLARQTIYRWSTGKRSPDLEQIEKVAEALGVPAWALIKDDTSGPSDLSLADLKSQLDRIELVLRKR